MPDDLLTPGPELWHLLERVHAVSGLAELRFLLLNETRHLLPYRQAALLDAQHTVLALSGIARADRHTPYAQWLEAVSASVPPSGPIQLLDRTMLPPALASQWDTWWPAHALMLQDGQGTRCLMTGDAAWSDAQLHSLAQWWTFWLRHVSLLQAPVATGWRAYAARLKTALQLQAGAPLWRQRPLQVIVALLLVSLFPVRLSVLAPGELVPVNPVWVRSPIEGVIDSFHVQPNQLVNKGTPLLGFDEILIQSRMEVAMQALFTAEAEYRQASQLALGDSKYKSQMSLLVGKIEEKRAEAEFLRSQLERARLVSPAEGVVLMDDPSEWIGKPVSIGERILRIAKPGDAEVEAWLPVADAIALKPGDSVTLHLNASPLSPVSAQVRYIAHDAVQRPDGQFAYRVRAALTESTTHRIGLKGTAKLNADSVPLAFWVMRRPLASLRSAIGL